MKILVTGSNGFVGRNLVWNLKEIQEGKNRTRQNLNITGIFSYDLKSSDEELEYYCRNCDFVFHLAGVNRTKEKSEFMEGNVGLAGLLLETLKKCDNSCPVMLSSSSQAALTGRFADSEYGRSKLEGEELFFRYEQETGARVCVYRFPNVFGKWCKPGYNSAVATFCHAVANDLEYTVHDPGTELELVYIDDLINEMLDVLEEKEHRCEYDGLKCFPEGGGRYCHVPVTHYATLGEIVNLLNSFHAFSSTRCLPEMSAGSFSWKLYSTYLSYLPPEKMVCELKSDVDNRGSFTELMRTLNYGQISINVAKPGITRGQHWHNSKCEIFIVVSGHGLIQEQRIGTDPETGNPYPVIGFEVTGDQMRAVQVLPGYTHNIINLSETENLITIMWANEPFDPDHPDTYFEPVQTEK